MRVPGPAGAPKSDRGLASPNVVASAALALPAAAVGAAVDLMGMFRSDYRFTAREVPKDRSALISAIVASLNSASIRVAMEDFRRGDDDMFKRLDKVQERRDRLETLTIRCEVAQISPRRSEIDELDAAIGRLQAGGAGGGLMSEFSEKTQRRRDLLDQLPPFEAAARKGPGSAHVMRRIRRRGGSFTSEGLSAHRLSRTPGRTPQECNEFPLPAVSERGFGWGRDNYTP
jgi:hypothetical protein